MYLGVDGGGTKTAFALVSDHGEVVARSVGGGCYHPEVGLAAVQQILAEGVRALLAGAGLPAGAITHAFLGLPAFGEDPVADATLVSLPASFLPAGRYLVGNDMVCSWAGALGCVDGISVIAGTGSIAYGEYAGRQSRSGGWGEVFGDEGSAYWIAREALTLFARMSDGRLDPGPLHGMIGAHFRLADSLDLAGHINGLAGSERSSIARLATVAARAAVAGDTAAQDLYVRAAAELASVIAAVRRNLGVPDGVTLPVSYTGGVFRAGQLILQPLARALAALGRYSLAPPRLEPVIGAAVYAARRAGVSLPLERLRPAAADDQGDGEPVMPAAAPA